MKFLCSRVLFASDHRGVALKSALMAAFAVQEPGVDVEDLGPYTSDAVDYPLYAYRLAEAIAADHRGVLICGTGIGMSMAANRYPHIRGALCHTPYEALKSRQHNDANVLILGAETFDLPQATACLKAFLITPFEGGRHQNRLDAFNLLAAPFWHHKI